MSFLPATLLLQGLIHTTWQISTLCMLSMKPSPSGETLWIEIHQSTSKALLHTSACWNSCTYTCASTPTMLIWKSGPCCIVRQTGWIWRSFRTSYLLMKMCALSLSLQVVMANSLVTTLAGRKALVSTMHTTCHSQLRVLCFVINKKVFNS